MLTIAAMAIGFGVVPVAAQEREQRRELESRLQELRAQLRDVERQLRDVRGSNSFFRGVLTWSSNRAQLGVFVRSEADPETDRIGALLQSVPDGGAAQEAGLQDGDIIISFDGERLAGRYPAADPDESEPAKKLIDLIGDKDPGDEVTIEYQRDGETRSTVVT
ncbi:MAG: PDZ domain-containing protein, partial [Planctomycetota bacterium]|nr:PDZ domain-containing protein [Planctomycetota bacterium]